MTFRDRLATFLLSGLLILAVTAALVGRPLL